MYIYSKSNIYAKFIGSFKKFKCGHMKSLQEASKNQIYIYPKSNIFTKFVGSFQKFQM